MTMNPARERQDQVKADVRVIGVDDWKSLLTETVHLKDAVWQDLCGGSEVPLYTYCMAVAVVKDVSFLRVAFGKLLEKGYVVEELVVEFMNPTEAAWGKCTWYKEHPSYPRELPINNSFRMMPVVPNLMHALFATEYAGDQHGLFYSMQTVTSPRPLVNETIVFHKIVLSPPPVAVATAVDG